MTNEQYYNMDPELKERLQRKSYFLFKSKHKWRKIEDRLNCGAKFLEEQFDKQIELEQKKLDIMRKIKKDVNNAKELDRKNARSDAGRNAKPVVENKQRVCTAIYGRR